MINQPGQWVDKIHDRKPVKGIILTWTVLRSEDRKALPTMVILAIHVSCHDFVVIHEIS